MSSRFRNIGAYIKTVTSAFAIAATAEVDGSAVQTVAPGETYLSCKLLIHVGAVAGAPSAVSVAAKLQTSANGTSGWTDIAGASISPIAAANTDAAVDVNLAGSLGYVRAVVTPSFTGGSSPSADVAAVIILGGANELPAA